MVFKLSSERWQQVLNEFQKVGCLNFVHLNVFMKKILVDMLKCPSSRLKPADVKPLMNRSFWHEELGVKSTL